MMTISCTRTGSSTSSTGTFSRLRKSADEAEAKKQVTGWLPQTLRRKKAGSRSVAAPSMYLYTRLFNNCPSFSHLEESGRDANDEKGTIGSGYSRPVSGQPRR